MNQGVGNKRADLVECHFLFWYWNALNIMIQKIKCVKKRKTKLHEEQVLNLNVTLIFFFFVTDATI